MKDILSIGIYKITCLATNKSYIGQTGISFKNRWYKHKIQLNLGNHGNSKLQRAWNKYEESNFKFEILEVCDKHILDEREQYWIKTLNSIKSGFNICEISHSRLGTKWENASKIKLSDTIKRLGIKNHAGKKLTKEHNSKLQEAGKATRYVVGYTKIVSEATKKKMSQSHLLRWKKIKDITNPLTNLTQER